MGTEAGQRQTAGGLEPSADGHRGLSTGAQAPGARTFAINVRIHGVQSELQVCSNDTAYALKTRLHCEPPGGEEDVVPPPSVTRLLFGGIEIADNDMLEAHEIEDQAEVSLKWEPGIRVRVVLPAHLPLEATMWGEECIGEALARVLQSTAAVPSKRRWAIQGRQGRLPLDALVKDTGLLEGDSLISIDKLWSKVLLAQHIYLSHTCHAVPCRGVSASSTFDDSWGHLM